MKESELNLTKETNPHPNWSWISVYFINYVASKSISWTNFPSMMLLFQKPVTVNKCFLVCLLCMLFLSNMGQIKASDQ